MENFDLCPVYEYCGGCRYQGIPYEDQLHEKESEISQLFKRFKVDASVYHGLTPAIECYSYRNKMEYTFGDFEKGGPLSLGLHKKKNFMSIVTCDCCELVHPDFNKVLRITLDFCSERNYPFYHKKTHVGLLRNLVVRRGVNTGELIVDIVTSSQGNFDGKSYAEALLSASFENTLVGVLHTTNDALADAVIDEGTEILFGRDFYQEEILGLKFKVKIFAFFQTNIPAAERLYSEALALLPDINEKTIYDLYCGTGTISQLAAAKAKKVYGIEIVPDAVEAAIDNASLNDIKNCEFICGDVRKKLDELKEKPDMIIVDPPRVGMHDKVIDMLSSYGTEYILYISCNPKTMFMNLERFADYGYQPVYIKSYDNFPMTKHMEAVSLLHRSQLQVV